MKNKNILKNVVYIVVLAIVIISSTYNLLAVEETSCTGGQYLNREAIEGESCECGGEIITQKTCEFKQWSTCNKVTCF
jgi:hypothetical protein